MQLSGRTIVTIELDRDVRPVLTATVAQDNDLALILRDLGNFVVKLPEHLAQQGLLVGRPVANGELRLPPRLRWNRHRSAPRARYHVCLLVAERTGRASGWPHRSVGGTTALRAQKACGTLRKPILITSDPFPPGGTEEGCTLGTPNRGARHVDPRETRLELRIRAPTRDDSQ